MIYGQQKVLTMQRSILPSSGRTGARHSKRRLVHSNRRSNNQQLTQFKGPAEYVEELWDNAHLTYWETPNRHDYGDIIMWRRSCDKLAPFEMWAYKRTLHLRPEDRLSKISGLLPKGVIGDHALSHLSFLERPHDSGHTYMQGLPSQLRRY